MSLSEGHIFSHHHRQAIGIGLPDKFIRKINVKEDLKKPSLTVRLPMALILLIGTGLPEETQVLANISRSTGLVMDTLLQS